MAKNQKSQTLLKSSRLIAGTIAFPGGPAEVKVIAKLLRERCALAGISAQELQDGIGYELAALEQEGWGQEIPPEEAQPLIKIAVDAIEAWIDNSQRYWLEIEDRTSWSYRYVEVTQDEFTQLQTALSGNPSAPLPDSLRLILERHALPPRDSRVRDGIDLKKMVRLVID